MGSFNDLEGINDCDEGIDIEKKEFVGYNKRNYIQYSIILIYQKRHKIKWLQ